MSDLEALRGVWLIVPTPFGEDGSLDAASMRTLTDFAIRSGVDGITILGVMGEATRIGDSERTTVVETTIDAAAGRIPVCVGVSHAGTDQALRYAREAEALGAHSVMLAPPSLSRPNEAAVRRHYMAVAEAIGVPIVVQDHPASSGVWMGVELLASLAREIPSCRTIKLEEEPTPLKMELVLKANPDARLLGGLGAIMLIEELRRGAVGTMTGFGFPEVLCDIVRRWNSGDIDGATVAFYKYVPLIRFESQPILGLAIRKHLYRLRGAIASERVRAPAMPLDGGSIRELNDLLDRLGLGRGVFATTDA